MKTNFLNPTTKKVVLAIILAISFVPFIYYDTGIRCITTPCPAGKLGSLVSYALFSYHWNIYDSGIKYPNLIIGLIISYIIAALIIHNYKKE